MEEILQHKVSENKLTIYLNKEINSANAFDVEKALMALVNQYAESNDTEIVLDFENLNYVASAGLRILLGLKKVHPNFRIIKVKDDVYDVLEMTGFTTLLNVSKMYKEVSIDGLELIGEGYIGKVYRLDEDRIIKVFVRINSKEDIYRERSLSKSAFLLGIPTAISYEIVKVKEGGYGMIYEMLKSDCLNKVMAKDLDNYSKYQKMYVDLLKTILFTKVPEGELPDKKEAAKEWFKILRENKDFDEEVISKIEKMTMSLPDTNTMIHGDCHIKNIMLQNGEPLLIDMETLGVGHPIFEIAGFYLTYLGYPAIDHDNCFEFLGLDYEYCKRLYFDTLKDLLADKNQLEDVQNKVELLSYAWLTAKTHLYDPNNTKRLDDAKKKVLELVNKVETLTFEITN